MAKIENNLTEGSVVRQMVLFSIPFVLSSVVQNLYGLVDMIVVGQFAGAVSLSAVNTSSSYVSTITNVAIGLSTGGTVVIGQYLGMKNREKLQQAIGTLTTFIILLAVALTALTLIFSRPILNLLQTPDETYSEALIYLIVSGIGFVFIFGYNLISAILRGVGDSRSPFIFICIACAINVVLDILLIGPMQMGAMGAALATVIAQGVSMILCIVYLNRNDFVFDFKLKNMRIHGDVLRVLLKIGVPTTIQSTITVFAYTILTAVANSLGVIPSAALAGAQKITLFAILPSIAFGNAISAMSAQNFGAGRKDRALNTLKVGFLLTMGVNIVLFAIIEFFPGVFMHAFGSDPELIRQGIIYLRWCSLDFLFVPIHGCIGGYLIGSGHSALPALLNTLSTLFIRSPFAYLLGLPLGLGIAGVAIATPINSLSLALFFGIYYLSGKCKTIEPVITDHNE